MLSPDLLALTINEKIAITLTPPSWGHVLTLDLPICL